MQQSLSKNRYFYLLSPILWGLLSYLIFSVVRPRIPASQVLSVPLWIWFWVAQMLLFVPFWLALSKERYQDEQRNSIRIFGRTIPFGKPSHYLLIAYFTAILAIPLHGTWYSDWLVFGGIVSPIFEELFARNTLTPWLKARWPSYIGVSIISSASFAVMHWGFNNAEAFSLTPVQQFQKFLAHFVFGLVLCLIFRFTKSVQPLIWLHIISNLPFIITKL